MAKKKRRKALYQRLKHALNERIEFSKGRLDLTSPSHAALRAELSEQLETALSAMSDVDREVLALRHFEELTNRETAQVLDITEQAASVRYVRALARLKNVMTAIDGATDD